MDRNEAKGDILQEISIAAPCGFGWDNMRGDEKVRFCPGCSQNVYNVSEMTAGQARDFLSSNGRTACLRLYRRSDGTLITKNCPIGLQRFRNLWSKIRQAAAAIALVLIPLAPTKAERSSPDTNSKDTDTSRFRTYGPAEPVVIEGYPHHATPCQVGPANWDAYNLLLQAEQYEEKEPALAEATYKKALKSVKASKGDPKFASVIARNYVNFLKNVNRKDEALKIEAQYGLSESEPSP